MRRAWRLPASRAEWTLEEHARFAALRDVEMLRLLVADPRLLARARQQQLLPAFAGGAAEAHAAANAAARPPVAGPLCAKGSVPSPEGARVTADLCGGAAAGEQAAAPLQHGAAQRPRRRSAAKVVERQAKFDAKRRRRKFFEVLPLLGAFIRRAAAAGGDGSLPMQSDATDGAPPGGAERRCAADGLGGSAAVAPGTHDGPEGGLESASGDGVGCGGGGDVCGACPCVTTLCEAMGQSEKRPECPPSPPLPARGRGGT